jgi:hypothetical protein
MQLLSEAPLINNSVISSFLRTKNDDSRPVSSVNVHFDFFITTSQRKETNNTGNYIACATLMVFSGISDVKVLFKVKFNWSYKR